MRELIYVGTNKNGETFETSSWGEKEVKKAEGYTFIEKLVKVQTPKPATEK